MIQTHPGEHRRRLRGPMKPARAPLVALILLTAASPAGAVTGRQPAAGNLLFARLTMERREVFSQEVFGLTISVFNCGLNMGREIAIRDLETPGMTLLPLRDGGSGRETIAGKACGVRRFLGHARAAAGTYTLRPTVLSSVVAPLGGPGGRAEVRQVALSAPPVTVTVRPLPETGKPGGFSGAVGSFTFKAAASPGAVTEGTPVTLTMEIAGRGTIDTVTAPRLQPGATFTCYDPKLTRSEIGEDRTRGRLVFEQTVIPRSASLTSLPAVAFSWFDPAARAYREIRAGPFPLTVTPSARPAEVVVEAPASGTGVRDPDLLAGIAPLKPPPRTWPSAQRVPWHAAPWFSVLLIVPTGLLLALIAIARRRTALAGDVAKARRQLAPEAARQGIAAAESALRQGDRTRFHNALWEALCSYFGHRLNLRPGEISGDSVTGRLTQAGLARESVKRLREVFNISEQERFSPPQAAGAALPEKEARRLAGLLDELGRLLQECEKVPL